MLNPCVLSVRDTGTDCVSLVGAILVVNGSLVRFQVPRNPTARSRQFRRQILAIERNALTAEPTAVGVYEGNPPKTYDMGNGA